MESPYNKTSLLTLLAVVVSLVAMGCSPKGPHARDGFGLKRGKSKEIFSNTASLPAENGSRGHSNLSQKSIAGDGENDVALVSYSQAGNVTWHESLEQAAKLSAETGKPILADFTGSDWCGFCIKLKDEVFASPQFQLWAADNVILLEIDYPKRSSQASWLRAQNAQLKKQYNISSYPTVLLLTAEGRTIGQLGYMSDADKWIAVANNAIRADESITRLDREASAPTNTSR